MRGISFTTHSGSNLCFLFFYFVSPKDVVPVAGVFRLGGNNWRHGDKNRQESSKVETNLLFLKTVKLWKSLERWALAKGKVIPLSSTRILFSSAVLVSSKTSAHKEATQQTARYCGGCLEALFNFKTFKTKPCIPECTASASYNEAHLYFLLSTSRTHYLCEGCFHGAMILMQV